MFREYNQIIRNKIQKTWSNYMHTRPYYIVHVHHKYDSKRHYKRVVQGVSRKGSDLKC